MNKPRTHLYAILLITLALTATACSTLTNAKPRVVIDSPPSSSQYRGGELVTVQSTSTDATGITRVDLLVDGTVVRTDTPPSPQLSYTVLQTWTATPGDHSITVHAFNTTNVISNDAAIALVVIGASPAAAPTLTTVPTAAPMPSTATPVPSTATPVPPTATHAPAPACTNGATFVADVTIPDGTQFAPGQTFDKVWRLRNTGSCPWGAGYDFGFAGGANLSGLSAVAVPATAPGATADLAIPMVAPNQPGTYTGYWHLRSSGSPFGVRVYVIIRVVGPTQPIAPAPPYNPYYPALCSGAPSIASFYAFPTTIHAGQGATLYWGLVANADEADIDNNIGGIATPGSTVVNPGSTTTYTLTSRCGGTTTSASVTVFVTP